MRKLMWFTIGFALACAMGIYIASPIWVFFVGLFTLVGFGGSFLCSVKWVRVAGVLLLGFSAASAWLLGYDSIYLSHARAYDSQVIELSVTAADYSYAPAYGQAFDGYIELDGRSYRIRCYLNEEHEMMPGEKVTGEFALRYTAKGGEKDPTYHQGKGIFLIATQKSDVVYSTGKLRIQDYPALWRQKVKNLMENLFPADTLGFAKALLLGDTTGFTYRQDRDFQVSGLRHVVAVSGLHVSILFSLIYVIFGRQRVLNAVFGIPLLVLFAAIAGFTPSTVRACVMQGLVLLAMLVDKEYDPPTALSFAVLVILGCNPMAITSVSLQLSAGCMIGIFVFSEPLRQYLLSFGKLKEKSKGKSVRAKMIRWFTGSVAVTVSAMSLTTPLCAVYFGMISLVGILANLLTLWVISFIFYGIMLACVTSVIFLPIGQGIAWGVSWLIRYVLTVAGLLADFPLAAIYTDSIYIICWLILSYIILFVFFLLKKKNPLFAAGGILFLLVVSVALSWLEPRIDHTRISVINVGQGQSVLLQQEGEYYLVDCGGEHAGMTADTVVNFLLSQGIFRLDGVILTHYDTDHAGSVINLLTSVPADKIYLPDIQDSNGLREEIEREYPQQSCLISDNTELTLKDGKITLYPGVPKANDNENSVCVLFQPKNCDILITGDRSSVGERALIRETELPQLELLIAGHHGSHLATSLDLLLATYPDAVAISAGENNRYGHPREEVLNRLELFECDVYRTDVQGTIIFRG